MYLESNYFSFQIAIKNGLIHNWGLVEFQTSQEAETTLEALQGENIQGKPVRVQFCIPGVHAINIYMAFVNNPMDAVQERKALLDEAPTSKVYEQLHSLAKHNPWFVANLQSIMASSSMAMPPQLANVPPKTAPAAKPDPAQAALILFLAGKVAAKGSPDQTANLVQSIVKQMALGTKASEILRSVVGVKNADNEADLIQAAINMSKGPELATAKPKSDKCPLLNELLYKSFQAKLAKEQKMQQKKSSPMLATSPTSSSSSSSMSSTCNSNNNNPPLVNLPFQFATANDILTVQPPQVPSYPYLYYPQLLQSPTTWPQQYPGLVQQQQPHNDTTALAIMMQQYQLQAAGFGVKRAAAPVMYAPCTAEKRMKLA